MRAYYRPFVLEDFISVMDLDLRQADTEEIEAASGFSWKVALQLSVQYSQHCWVVIYNNKIEAVFGVAEETPEIGVPWFVATNKFSQFSYRVARQSKEVIQQMLKLYPTLRNYVSAKNFESVRWLKWLGFELSKDYTYLRDPVVPFIEFQMRRK
jgi:hypothetical protein